MSKKRAKLINGEVIAYQKKGYGEKVVLLVHGNMCSSEHYSTLLREINPTLYTVYALDLRGFGDSTYNSPIKTVSDLSNDIQLFINYMNIETVYLIGWSAGGPVCLQLCIDYPDLVEGIILLSPVGFKGAPLQKKDQSGANTGKYYDSKDEMAQDPEVSIPSKAIHNNDFITLNNMWNLGIYTNKKPSNFISTLLINETLKQQNLEDIYWALAHFNLSNEYNGYSQGDGQIKQINVPVLCFWGEQDLIIKFEDVKDIVNSLPYATLRVLKACGHSPLVDHLDEILKGIDEMFG
ncbi:alpha/beta fold hydrolase [Halalkalibacter sp. APA_J-10(15)]|uniref:intracellular short-chain-length polyhydroxyalkanoate depolymerase n=1 Tax=Halalkalibacter sp. APA_J-10(15) TaxID=2933805 RepID=UPI001FF60EF6|nr:alpha/beta hydrolase [Halalkalibacter sp. APA_J-10(15)]MCK0470696.1 alpha/beta hydrolase [Halalkalibacter sp. APA_J-10(15)]